MRKKNRGFNPSLQKRQRIFVPEVVDTAINGGFITRSMVQLGVEVLAIVSSILALLVAAFFTRWVTRQDRGSAEMQEFSDEIHQGAMTFLNKEYR